MGKNHSEIDGLPKEHLDSYGGAFYPMPKLRPDGEVWRAKYRGHDLKIEPPGFMSPSQDQWKIWVRGPGWKDWEHDDSDRLAGGLDGVLRAIDYHLNKKGRDDE